MSDQKGDKPPVTVEELLPAIVELASIQFDLMRRLQADRGEHHRLIERSSVLLKWLLAEAARGP